MKKDFYFNMNRVDVNVDLVKVYIFYIFQSKNSNIINEGESVRN